jgi:hypothetical protein
MTVLIYLYILAYIINMRLHDFINIFIYSYVLAYIINMRLHDCSETFIYTYIYSYYYYELHDFNIVICTSIFYYYKTTCFY